MTFTLTPVIFAQLQKELADSHQAAMSPAPTSSAGVESGTITHDNVIATYSYAPSTAVLDVEVIHGGNIIVNHVIHSKVADAIATLQKPAPPVPVGTAPKAA